MGFFIGTLAVAITPSILKMLPVAHIEEGRMPGSTIGALADSDLRAETCLNHESAIRVLWPPSWTPTVFQTIAALAIYSFGPFFYILWGSRLFCFKVLPGKLVNAQGPRCRAL